ncbi:helix-turn-helix domain-containing protein [Streptomyces sp. NPDC055036]
MTTHPCRITECPRTAAPQHRMCHTHRYRQWRHGNPHQTHATPDPIAIDAAVRDRRPPAGMSPKERAAAGVQLTNLGLPASEIARIFAVTPRTVARWRAAARATQAA